MVHIATIKDVAKKSGFSVGTVSAVLNNKNVSSHTRDCVLQVARELNYSPNMLAQGLVTKVSKTIGIVIYGDESMSFMTNPFFFDIIKHLNLALHDAGYKGMLHFILYNNFETELQHIANSKLNDAIIIISYRHDNEVLLRVMDNSSIPFMTVINDPVDDSVFSVAVDNEQCAKQATVFLLQRGHRRIAFVGKADDHSLSRSRFAGYKKALLEYGIPEDPELILAGNYTRESGVLAAQHILNYAKPLPTAIFALNDLMATGVYGELLRQNIVIPKQISLIGIDDLPGVDLYAVPLTTVNICGADIGRLAAKKIIGALSGEDDLPNHIKIGFTLVNRASVATIT